MEIKNYKKQSLILVSLFLFGLSSWGGYRMYTSHYESKASELFQQSKFTDVVSHYPRSQMAILALMSLGQKAFEDGHYEEAIPYYSSARSSKRSSPIVKVGATHQLALAYLKKGNPSEAEKLLEEISKDSANKIPDYSKILLARTYEVQGDLEKAKTLYKNLSEGTTLYSLREEAKERLNWLEKNQK